MEKLLDTTDEKKIRELTEKYRGKRIKFKKYINKEWTDYDFEAIISHFTSLRTLSAEFENKLVNVHDESFYFIK